MFSVELLNSFVTDGGTIEYDAVTFGKMSLGI
ncbi:hypothetical protein BASH2_01837 [Bacillus anthracis]|nr:hypothetical protein BASH2_01837 [Bacillus anthracis]